MARGITKIDENLWAAEGWAKMMPGCYMPARSTVAKLGNGSLLLHSPIEFTQEQAAAIGELGEVAYLMAPNLFHNLYLRHAKELFPDAQIIGPQGLEKKAKGITVDASFGKELPAPLVEEFEHVHIEGAPSFRELVLRHRRTKSLVVGDYFFNVVETKGWLTPLVLKMTDASGRPTQSKLWRKVVKDRAAMQKSAREVLALDDQRVVMCHGKIVEDGRDFTRECLQYWE